MMEELIAEKHHYHWQMCIIALIAFAFLFAYIYQGIDAIQNKFSDIRSLLDNSQMFLNCTEWATTNTITQEWYDNCCVKINIQNYVSDNNNLCYDFVQPNRFKGIYNISFGGNIVGSIDAEKCYNTQKYTLGCKKWEIVEE